MAVEVRPAHPHEQDAIAAVLRAAGLGANVGRLLEYPRTSPTGEVFAAVRRDQIVGAAAVAGFGATGWIGALGVVSAARRRGAGTALTEAATEWLRAHGARTVLLYATPAGRPVYQRVGFVAEGEAHAWRDVSPPPLADPPTGIRTLSRGDLADVRALDTAATGEDRSAVIEVLVASGNGAGMILERDGAVAGSALRSPWGLGPSVVAGDADAGLALLSALRRRPGSPLTVSIPDANVSAGRALRAWGMRPINQATRMRLGPAPAYDPARVFGMFNLFWGMTWEPELDELRRRTELAHRMGGSERVERQHREGRLTIRERIERLFDPGTFRETGGLAGSGTYGDDGELTAFRPANMVVGQGRIEGRRAIVQGDDFTVRGGAADAAIHGKGVWAEQAAHDLRVPLVRLVDGTGGGGSVKSLEDMGFSYVPHVPGFDLYGANLSRVPVVAAALGPCAGLGAARVVATHFSVIVRGSAQLFVAGPPVVAMAGMGEAPGKEELGGARLQTAAGAVDNEAADEDDALAQLRRFLSYLPANVWELAPIAESADPVDRREEELLALVPRDPRKPYKMRRVLDAVLDRGSVFEVGARYGRSLITALARLDGRAVGVLASDPQHYAGGLTADASDKLARFVDVCDQFRLPVVNFVDQPGFVIGTAAERAGTIRRGTRAMVAVYQATVPWASVLVRKVYGVAGAAHANHARLQARYAWPSGDWGSLPIAGGLEAAYRRELEAASDPAELRREIEARLNAVRSPFRTAERFGVEEIIDPRDTRPLLCDWAARAYEVLEHERGGGPKARGLRP